MKIAIYVENLLSANGGGGAEVYTLKLAELLSKENEVTLFTIYNKINNRQPSDVFKKYSSKNMDVKKIFFKHYKDKSFEIINRIFFWLKLKTEISNRYDAFINCCQNRLIGFFKITSVHLIHFPCDAYSEILPKIIGKRLDSWYRKSYKFFICNSEFTKRHLKKIWDIDGIVLNPPIDMLPIKNNILKNKKKHILMVGRLVPDKKIIEMLKLFISPLNKDVFSEYEFVVVGNKNINYLEYFDTLKHFEISKKIRIVSDVSHEELVRYYRDSEIFLHAKGYGVDEEKTPLLTEHFGMVTVEAMANGCIPIVINKAGQKEIVENGVDGFLWNNLSEIAEYVSKISNDDSLRTRLQLNAIEKSKKFLMPEFERKATLLFKDILGE